MRDKLVANIIFIFEIEVKSTLGNACFIYNIRDRRLVGPFCGKKLKGCIEQSIFSFFAFSFPVFPYESPFRTVDFWFRDLL